MTVLHGQSISQSVLVSQQLHVETQDLLALLLDYPAFIIWLAFVGDITRGLIG